jgi:hypothetical protein
MAREFFRVYFTDMDLLKGLSDSEVGRLFVAMLEYSIHGEYRPLRGNERAMFPFFKARIDEEKEWDVTGVPRSGKYHWNWKGGITPENSVIRNSNEYRNWRKAVYQRDDYTCQFCGAYGGKLNAHHIKRFSENVEGRVDVDNGVTLCAECHKRVHRRI